MAYLKIRVTDSDALLAQLCSLVYNSNRRQGARALGPDDFLPRLKKPARDGGAVVRKLKMWAQMMTAKNKP